MREQTFRSRRDGFALALTLIVILGVAAVAGGAIIVNMNSALIRSYYDRHDELSRAADAALEETRARLNADRSLYPDSGFAILELDAPVVDGAGQPIPAMMRSTWVGPTGITSGEYGVFGSVVTQVRSGPNVVVRRGQIVQESFARYAYFTDFEPSSIAFGGGDQIDGPVHSNDQIRIYSSGATFKGPVTTAEDVDGAQYATFEQGVTEHVSAIPLPDLADLQKLQTQGSQGGTAFTATSGNPPGRATLRIEFVAIDLNGDGDTRDEGEGFIRVYRSADTEWVVAAAPVDSLRSSRNCGHFHGSTFISAADHPGSGTDNFMAALSSSTRRCFLGGAPELFGGFQASDAHGQWLSWSGPVSPLLSTRPDRDHLFPINRSLNPSFKGVIFVNGDVAISGVLRGRVTVAATGDIVIADDVTYATDPSVGTCEDILGLFAGGNVVVANTPINAPWRRRAQTGQSYFTYDDTEDERIHAFVLTLNQFYVQDYNQGSTSAQPCGTTNWGRGCLYLTGGIIQRQRGPVGLTSGTGYLKRYSYDSCGVSAPPPYFPTTGRFSRSAFFDIDPTGFDVAALFQMLTPPAH